MAIKAGDIFVVMGLDSKDFEKGMGNLGKQMTAAGKQLSLKVTAPLTALAGLSIKTAATYSKSMAKVKAVTGATAGEFEQLNALAQQLGKTTQFTASEVASAMSFMGMAGMDVNTIMASLEDTLNLAAAGALDMGTAADIVTNIMAGFGLESDQIGRAVDTLTKVFTSSNVSLEQLGESMKYGAPVARTFGMSLEETTAIMGMFGNAGIQGSMAGTRLQQAILQLSKKAEDLGLNIHDANGEMLPMVGILEQIEASGIPTTELIKELGARAGPGLAILLQNGSTALREYTNEIYAAGGITKQVAETQMEGLHGTLIILKSAFESLQLAIADELVPVFVPLVEWLTKVFRWFSGLPGPVKKTAVIIGMLAAALGPMLILIPMLVNGLMAFLAILPILQAAIMQFGASITMTTGIVGLLSVAIMALVMAYDKWGHSTKEQAKFTGFATKNTDAYIESLEKLKKATEDADEEVKAIIFDERTLNNMRDQTIRLLANEEEGTKDYNLALARLKDIENELATVQKDRQYVQEAQRSIDEEAIAQADALASAIEKQNMEIATNKEMLDLANESLRDSEEAYQVAAENVNVLKGQISAFDETIGSLREQIDAANRELDELTSPRLEGMQQFEDQLFGISQAMKQIELDELKGVQTTTESLRNILGDIPEDKLQKILSTGDTEDISKALSDYRKELELTRDLSFEPLQRSAKEAVEDIKGLNDEIASETVMQRIEQLGKQLSEDSQMVADLETGKVAIQTKLKEAEAALEWEESIVKLKKDLIDNITTAAEESDKKLAWLKANAEGYASDMATAAQNAAYQWQNLLSLAGQGTGNTTPNPVVGPIKPFANGGLIPEPTAMLGLRSKRMYGIAGERGTERIVPGAGSGGGGTIVVDNLVLNVEGEGLMDGLMERAVGKIRDTQGLDF